MAYNLRLKDDIAVFTKRLFYALCDDAETQKIEFSELGETFCKLVSHTSKEDVETLWDLFLQKMPSIKESIAQDAIATEQNDPACKGLQEVYLAYPGFHAIAVYRLSHELFKLDLPIISRMMSEYIHGITGIDIHPGATIGNSFFIDHGTGIVIGETTIIKNNVKIYQGVTLGGLSIKKSRHIQVYSDGCQACKNHINNVEIGKCAGCNLEVVSINEGLESVQKKLNQYKIQIHPTTIIDNKIKIEGIPDFYWQCGGEFYDMLKDKYPLKL